jgi:GNAT superfamily N-acetyltransferase
VTAAAPRIRVATLTDAAMLAALGRRTFHDAYASAHPLPTDLQVHMDRHYGERQQAAELADPAATTLVMEQDGAVIGYALVGDDDPPECVRGPAPIQVRRFYLEQPWTGRGLGQALMAAVEREALRREGRTLWLVAWNRNFRALAFYRKCGFQQVGTMPYLFGNTVETDVVLARPTAP